MEGRKMSIVRSFHVNVPPLGLQHTFATRVSDIHQAMSRDELR